MPKGNSGIRRNGGKTGATPVQKTPEELIFKRNIRVASRNDMPE